MAQAGNKERILEISEKLGLSHIGSCISVLPILEEIYAKKKIEDKVVLDNAHAHLAHLIVRQHYDYEHKMWDWAEGNAEMLIEEYGIHCDRAAGCDASGGSLGHGLGIGIGMALANPNIKVSVIVSDGSMMEGSNWEALRIISDLNIRNIHIYCNFNGYTAVSKYKFTISKGRVEDYLGDEGINIKFYPTKNGEGFEGVEGHYKKL